MLLKVLAVAALAAAHYQNPILFADYSDPDVIRVGRDYYLVASTFHFSPGLPVLQSRDLVHWRIIGHVLAKLPFAPEYNRPGERYAGGVWAPAIRYHDGLFYAYWPTPKEGIFMATARRPQGPWSEPVAVLPGAGYEDPCPFWDDDGQAYLVHSRVGAGPLILHHMSRDGTMVLDAGRTIVEDRQNLPVLEGPSFTSVMAGTTSSCRSEELRKDHRSRYGHAIFKGLTRPASFSRKATRLCKVLTRAAMSRRPRAKAGSFTSTAAARSDELSTSSPCVGRTTGLSWAMRDSR